MKAILITLGIGSLLLSTSALAADACCPPAAAKGGKISVAPASSPNVSKVTLKVSGMTCSKCAASVENALKKVEGVKAADVNLAENSAVITVDAAQVKTANLIAAVDKAGGDRHAFKAEDASGPAKKPQQIFCEGKSAGQLCGEGTVNALKLSGEKKAAWAEATKRYNAAVEAATKQLQQDAKATLSSEEAATVEKWFVKGINTQINQRLAKGGD